MKRPEKQKILVIRNDKIGDFMLAYPSFALLKTHLPDVTIYALVPEYTRELAESCPWIDGIIIDPGRHSGWHRTVDLISTVRKTRFDAVITLFSTTRIGFAVFLAGIPYRLAPATKIAQIFYNRRLTQRRSRSEKPEFAYNLDLARTFLGDQGIHASTEPAPPLLQFDPEHVARMKIAFCRAHNIDSSKKLVFIHAGSGGSAKNLSVVQYAELASRLESRHGHVIVITAGPGEESTVHRLSALLQKTPHVIYKSKAGAGLRRFAEHIQSADLFISGSTGPLHIAGALDRPTAAFYPRRRSSTAVRWQPLNQTCKHLAFTPPDSVDEHAMASIDIEEAARKISQSFLMSY